MIKGPDAEAIHDIVLLENDAVAGKIPPSSTFSGAGRLIYTEIDEVFLLCNACEHGACKIDYWIRGGEYHGVRPPIPLLSKVPAVGGFALW